MSILVTFWPSVSRIDRFNRRWYCRCVFSHVVLVRVWWRKRQNPKRRFQKEQRHHSFDFIVDGGEGWPNHYKTSWHAPPEKERWGEEVPVAPPSFYPFLCDPDMTVVAVVRQFVWAFEGAAVQQASGDNTPFFEKNNSRLMEVTT